MTWDYQPNYSPDDQSRDIRTIEWVAGILRHYGELLSEWEDSRGAAGSS